VPIFRAGRPLNRIDIKRARHFESAVDAGKLDYFEVIKLWVETLLAGRSCRSARDSGMPVGYPLRWPGRRVCR